MYICTLCMYIHECGGLEFIQMIRKLKRSVLQFAFFGQNYYVSYPQCIHKPSFTESYLFPIVNMIMSTTV